MEIFITDCTSGSFRFEINASKSTILIISETVPIDFPDAFFQLKNSNLFQVIVVEDSISSQIYVIIYLFGLFK